MKNQIFFQNSLKLTLMAVLLSFSFTYSVNSFSKNSFTPYFFNEKKPHVEVSNNDDDKFEKAIKAIKLVYSWAKTRIDQANAQQRKMNEKRGEASYILVQESKKNGGEQLRKIIDDERVRSLLLFNLLKTNPENSNNTKHRDAALDIYECLPCSEIAKMANQKVKIIPLSKSSDPTHSVFSTIDRTNGRDSKKLWGTWMAKKLTPSQAKRYQSILSKCGR